MIVFNSTEQITKDICIPNSSLVFKAITWGPKILNGSTKNRIIPSSYDNIKAVRVVSPHSLKLKISSNKRIR